jgi:tyrosyl-tRNA synthetase
LRAKLAKGRPLRVKLGIDPTASDIHLGFAVVLRKLRQFQDLGHTAVLIVGDFTTRVGDPSGRNKTRPMLDREQIDAYCERVLGQFRIILSPGRLEIRRNSEWLDALGADGLLRLLSHSTLARTLERDDFAKRFREQSAISLMELCYPMLQAYDSVAVEADVEIGGTDQHFNLVAGRDLQRSFGQAPQVVVETPLLVGTDGMEKMSQSKGNYIGIAEDPAEMFGKVMSLPDEAMPQWFELAAELEMGEGESAVDAKRRLAGEIVRRYHGDAAALHARQRFDRIHREHRPPEDVPVRAIPPDCLDGNEVIVPRLLKEVGLAESSSEARRLLEQGGVKVDGEPLRDERVDAASLAGRLLQRGSRHFVRLA